MNYKTKGTCSREISFDVVDNKVTNVRFLGGCSGNTQGVAALVEGMDVNEAIKRMDGIDCARKRNFMSGPACKGIKIVLRRK